MSRLIDRRRSSVFLVVLSCSHSLRSAYPDTFRLSDFVERMLHHLEPDNLAALMAHPEAVRRLEVTQPAQIGAAYEAHRTCVVVKKIYNANHAIGPGVEYEEEWLPSADRVGILGRRNIVVWDDAPRGWFSHRIPGRFCVYVCGPLRGTINNEVRLHEFVHMPAIL